MSSSHPLSSKTASAESSAGDSSNPTEELRREIVALKAELEREKQEHQIHKSVVENLNTGVCTADANHAIVYVTPAFIAVTGFESDLLIGVKVEQLLVPEEVEEFQAVQQEVNQGRKPHKSEWRIMNRDGGIRTVRIQLSKHGGPNQAANFVYTVEDRTELAQYRAVVSSTQDLANVGAWQLDLANGELICTDEVYEVFALPTNTPLTLDKVIRCFFRESGSRLRALLEQAEQEGTEGEGEFELINEVGRFVLVRFTVRPQFLNGRLVKLIGGMQDITQEKRDRETLVRSEELHRNLTKHFPSGIILLLNRGFEILFADGQGLEETGLEKADIENQSLTHLLEDSISRQVEESIYKTFEGEATHLDLSFRGLDFSVELRPIYNSEGDIDRVLFVCLNITERKDWERQLRSSESRYRELFEANPSPILIVDEETEQILQANQEAILHYGYSQVEFTKMKWSELFDQESGPAIKTITGVSTDKHRTRSNDLLFVEVKSQPVEYDGGKVVLKIINDVTDRLLATQALHRSHQTLQKFHQALDAAALVVTLNLRGDFQSANANFCQSCGVASESLIGKSIRNFKGLQPSEEVWQDIVKKLRRGKIWKGELSLRREDGKPLWLASTIIPQYRGPDGRKSVLVISQDITEQKLAEVQVHQYAKRSTNILESITDAMFLMDRDWKVVYINKQGESLLQIDREQILDQNLWDLFPLEHAQKFFDQYNRAFTDNVVVHFEEYFEPLNIWFEVHAYPSSEGLSVYFRSINDRKEAEDRIRESETSLKEAQRIARMGNWEYRLGSNEVVWSDELFRLFHLDPVQDTPSLDIILKKIHRQDKPSVFHALRTAIEEGRGFDMDFRIVRDDGIRFFNFICRPEHDAVGGLDKLYGILFDITERKEVENKLLKSEYRLRVAQQLGKMGSWEYLPENDTVTLSEEAQELLGVPDQSEFSNLRSGLNAIEAGDKELLLVSLGEAIEDGKSFNIDLRLQISGQEELHLNVVGEPQQDGQGNFVKLYGTVMDITDRKVAEDELRESNEKLTKTNAELDRFVYSASHDLRAPMVSVLGLINLARSEGDIDRLRDYLGLMERSVRKLDNFVQEIIHYSRNSRLDVKAEPIDFREMIEGVIEDLQFMEEAPLVKRTVEIESDEDFFTDRGRLNVVVNNMVSNAFRYSSSHRREAYLRIRVVVKKGLASLTFEDNGQGIDESHLQGIFKMFYRASENSKGSGLGLYIVKESVDKLNGSISVTSTLGKGTTFTISLPSLTPTE